MYLLAAGCVLSHRSNFTSFFGFWRQVFEIPEEVQRPVPETGVLMRNFSPFIFHGKLSLRAGHPSVNNRIYFHLSANMSTSLLQTAGCQKHLWLLMLLASFDINLNQINKTTLSDDRIKHYIFLLQHIKLCLVLDIAVLAARLFPRKVQPFIIHQVKTSHRLLGARMGHRLWSVKRSVGWRSPPGWSFCCWVSEYTAWINSKILKEGRLHKAGVTSKSVHIPIYFFFNQLVGELGIKSKCKTFSWKTFLYMQTQKLMLLRNLQNYMCRSR